MKDSQLIVILGMHRSGTSAVAGALSLLGMDFDAHLVEAVPDDNPAGYWESVEIVKINNAIFTAFNMHYMDFSSLPKGWLGHVAMQPIRHKIKIWLQQSSVNNSFVVKDPRLCRTIPIWLEVLGQQGREVKCINVFRQPMEVVNSLRVRDDTFSIVEGLLVWLAHVFDSFVPSLSRQSTLASYQSIMRDPVFALGAIGKNLGLEWPTGPDAASEKLETFLDPSYTHQHFTGDIPFPPLNKLVESVYETLVDYDLKAPDKNFHNSFAKYQKQFQEFKYILEDVIKTYSNKLESEKLNAREQITYRDDLIAQIEESLRKVRENADAQVAYRQEVIALHEENIVNLTSTVEMLKCEVDSMVDDPLRALKNKIKIYISKK